MKRRTNRILSILLVVLSLALLAGAGFLLVQVAAAEGAAGGHVAGNELRL